MTPPVSFSAATATLPRVVVERVRQDWLDWNGTGFPVAELPFSDEGFKEIQAAAERRLRRLLAIPDDYAVLLSQGGAYGHFAMVALNLAGPAGRAGYVDSGLWSRRAMDEAAKVCDVAVVASAADDDGFRRLPLPAEWRGDEGAAYCHVTTNESAEGLQFADFPAPGPGAVPLVADMTGDFLTRPVDIRRFGLIYASAQKSLGAAGLTIIIARRDLLERRRPPLPTVFDYARLDEARSRVNTPPVLAIHLAGEMLRWMEDEGGLAVLGERRRQRCRRLYAVLDGSSAFVCRAHGADRSASTVCFHLVRPERQAEFLDRAARAGLHHLAGHPAVGGCRAMLHNAHSDTDLDRLVELLDQFARA